MLDTIAFAYIVLVNVMLRVYSFKLIKQSRFSLYGGQYISQKVLGLSLAMGSIPIDYWRSLNIESRMLL